MPPLPSVPPRPTRGERRTGLALPIIISMVFVLAILILAFNQFSVSRVRATGALLNDFSALMAAEAGIACVVLEMRNSQGWLTHEMVEGPGGEPEWGPELPRPVRITGDATVDIEQDPRGTYKGTIGSDVFQAEFRVRVGRLPLADDPDTPAIDESRRFVKIESIGKKADPTKKMDRYTRLEVIAEVSNFTEYVVYDGEKVILGMGSHNDSHHSNVFANGRIYGHQAVKLGNIRLNGTVQKFVNLAAVRSAGDIEYADSYDVTFQSPPSVAGRPFDLGPSNDSDGPSPLETAGGNVLDGNHGGGLTIPRIDPEFYRRQAAQGGIDVSALPEKPEYIPLYKNELPAQLIELDFGRGGYEGGQVPPDDEATLGAPYPADFNGLIYSSKPVSVWGCPDRDVTIFCEGDIFISGDFNISPRHRQNYRPKFQTADGTPIDGTPFYQYLDSSQVKWIDPSTGEEAPPDEKERVAVGLISTGRIWFDYRHPARFLANELRGLIKYELVSRLVPGDANALFDYLRYEDSSPTPNPPQIPAARVEGGVAQDGSPDLSTSLQSYFGRNGASKSNLFLTTASYDLVKEAFLDASQKGYLERKDLDGTPTKKGLLELVTERLQADEPEYASQWPTHPGGDLEPPLLGAFTAPQRLYELVYDERGANLNPPRKPHGKFSDLEGTRDEDDVDGVRWKFMEDELYMPQMSMYAMLFINAARNDGETGSDDPKSMDRRFDDLGNGRDMAQDGNARVHFLSTFQILDGGTSGTPNITTPLVQRFVGSEIRLAQVPNHPPALLTGNYWPPLRRRIYDQTLSIHPPPMIPQSVEVKTWKQLGAIKKDWEGF